MARRKVSALLLGPSVAAGVEAVSFAGFPGRFVPGEPVEVEALSAAAGVEASRLYELLEELELPLQVVDVKLGTGPLPIADNHVAGVGETFELPEAADEEVDDESAPDDEPAADEPNLEEASA